MKRDFFKHLSIEDVIVQRLGLDSIQRDVQNNFGLSFATLNKLKYSGFLKHNFKNWKEEKQKEFINLLGGPVNFDKTEDFIKHIIEQHEETI